MRSARRIRRPKDLVEGEGGGVWAIRSEGPGRAGQVLVKKSIPVRPGEHNAGGGAENGGNPIYLGVIWRGD